MLVFISTIASGAVAGLIAGGVLIWGDRRIRKRDAAKWGASQKLIVDKLTEVRQSLPNLLATVLKETEHPPEYIEQLSEALPDISKALDSVMSKLAETGDDDKAYRAGMLLYQEINTFLYTMTLWGTITNSQGMLVAFKANTAILEELVASPATGKNAAN